MRDTIVSPRLLSAALAALVLATPWVRPASANPAMPPARVPCHSYNDIVGQLDKRYAEAPISIGMQSNGNMLQVFANQERDSWTILSVSPKGVGCILAAGNNWESLQKTHIGPET